MASRTFWPEADIGVPKTGTGPGFLQGDGVTGEFSGRALFKAAVRSLLCAIRAAIVIFLDSDVLLPDADSVLVVLCAMGRRDMRGQCWPCYFVFLCQH